MKRLAKYFIENSFLVNMISLMMIIVGIYSLTQMKRDLISGWESNSISINTTLAGAGPAQMEKFVTYPIEQAIKNLNGIDKIYSESGQGWLWIDVRMKDGFKDVSELEQKIKDNIANLKSTLPNDLEDVDVKFNKMTESWFSGYSLTGFDENSDQHQQWFSKFKERLSQTDGIVRIWDSVRTKQIYIKLKPQELARFRIQPSEVYSKVVDAFTLYPVGSISKGGKDYLVEIENNEVDTATLTKIVIKANNSGHQLTLGDLAIINKELPKRTSRRYTNGVESVSFHIYKEIDTDTITLKEKVEKFVDEENKKAPEGIKIALTGDGPSFIERQINALKSNSIFGAILVVITLMLFLGFKNSLMTSFGLPLSYCFTFFVLSNLGVSIDLISVIGMLLVLGIIVDDAIIIAEQYSQHLEQGQAPKEAALNAVLKTWIPITGTVTTTIVAFLPILMANDSLSKILYAIPVVVIAALGISLFECFFILPNHLVHFVKNPKKESKNGYFEKFKNYYQSTLTIALKFRYLIIPVFIGFMGFSIYFAQKNIPMNFNLNISSEKIRFLATLKESKNLDETEKVLNDTVWKMLNKLDKERFDYISTTIGSAWINGKQYEGPKYSSFAVRFSQLDDNIEANKKYVEELLKKEMEVLNKTGLFEKLEVKRRFDGFDKMKDSLVEVKVSSRSPFNVNEIEESFKKELSSIEGVNSVDLADSESADSWTFKPNKSKIFAHGLSLSNVSRQLRAYVSKSKIYEYKAGPEILKIYSYVEDGEKQTKESLGNVDIILANGKTVKTKDLGQWVTIKKQKKIHHNDLKRSISVETSFDDKKIKKAELLKLVSEKVKIFEKKFPHLEFNAQDADEQSRKNKKSIGKNVIYSLLAIFFVLAVILKSVIQPLLICSAIPFGVIGVIWSFYFQGLKLDTMAFIGVIGMAGVVVNDSLILVDTINKMKGKWLDFKREFIILGASSRLRPILLTSITTLGGVFPMAYGIGGDSGFTKPLAMSMGWGLTFATSLTLFVIPCMLLVQADIIKFSLKLVAKLKKEEPKLVTTGIDLDKEITSQSLEDESLSQNLKVDNSEGPRDIIQ